MGEVYSDSYWSEMHPAVRRKLLLGSAGTMHLFETGLVALESDPELGVELLYAAYVASPLDGNIARKVAQLEGVLSFFPLPAASCLQAVLHSWKRPDNLSYFLRITSRREDGKIRKYILSCLEKEPENLFWVHQGLIYAGASSDFEFGLEILGGCFSEELQPAVSCCRSFYCYMLGEYEKALKELVAGAGVFGSNNVAGLAASISVALGDRESAVRVLAEAVGTQSWRVSEALRLHDLSGGVDEGSAPLSGKLAILLYSYNKAEELDATLRSLHNSKLHGAGIFLLDNGSGDETAAIIDKWQSRFGSQMVRIDLPVNIGAAAARNWLMNLPEVMECEFALYLDDDVEVEPDWLLKFGAAVKAYPEAGAWGCKVVDHYSPAVLQSVDLHIIQPSPDEGDGPEVDLTKIAPNPFKVSDLHHQLLDGGYFDYMRPCASVTGCCHLFRTSKLLDNGGFSLFLSPSQYDDMEHDLRNCLKGEFAVYQGHLRILHRKRTGAASRTDVVQEGNALGNKYKMQAMHPRSEILQIMTDEERLLQSDLEKKMQCLLDKGIVQGSK